MEEVRVSFELAKKLKEVGFKQKVLRVVDYSDGEVYDKPTLSITQKWFRETYNIHIIIKPAFDDYEVGICVKEDGTRDINYLKSSGGLILLFKTYELGLEAGLLKACEILKEKL